MKQMTTNTTSVPEIVELFTGNDFLKLLCEESNMYHNLNQGYVNIFLQSNQLSDISVQK